MDRHLNKLANDRIAFIGNYLPRQCGIATFTTDLCEAVAAEHRGATCIAVPVNDIRFVTPAPTDAARNRLVCVTTHDVMNPP